MDFQSIYEDGADAYDSLVSAEDVDGHLGPAIESILPLAGRTVVEVGAGTGRVTRLLAARGATVFATEPSADMTRVAATRARQATTATDVCLSRATASALPFRRGSVDAAIAGWVLAHQREWAPDDWRDVVAGFLVEMQRVVRPGGAIVLIETLGTGCTTPNPPVDLAEYYAWLETEQGFERSWIRTDYEFPSVEVAATITGSFFGPAFARQVEQNRWARVPECTGIWFRDHQYTPETFRPPPPRI